MERGAGKPSVEGRGGFAATVAPGEAVATELRAGQELRVVDLEGQQVADLVALRLGAPRERLSGPETLNFNLSMRLPPGSRLYSSLQRPLLEVVADTSAGVHDLTNAACSRAFYEHHLGVADHLNCHDSLRAALAGHGIEAWQVPDPINLFQNTPVAADGSVEDHPGSAGAGDYIVLRALVDLLVAVSSCPCKIGPPERNITGARPTPVRVEVSWPGGLEPARDAAAAEP